MLGQSRVQHYFLAARLIEPNNPAGYAFRRIQRDDISPRCGLYISLNANEAFLRLAYETIRQNESCRLLLNMHDFYHRIYGIQESELFHRLEMIESDTIHYALDIFRSRNERDIPDPETLVKDLSTNSNQKPQRTFR